MHGFLALRFISILLRTIGWTTALIGFIFGLLPNIPIDWLEPLREFDELGLIDMSHNIPQKFLFYGISAFMVGILFAGFGDMFKVFVQISDNTRRSVSK